MLTNMNPKILGSFLIGFALVAGSYTISNFGQPTAHLPALALESKAPARVAITVTDKDDNGVEDWRDQFFTIEPITLNEANASEYTTPTTLTGRLSISLLENVVRSKNAGPFGRGDDVVIDETLSVYTDEARDRLYEVKDVEIIEQWDETVIKNYANTMAGIVLNVNVTPKENEVGIFNDIVTRGDTKRMAELIEILNGYKSILEQSATVPVPSIFVKEHLDILNTYNAIYNDILAMTKVSEDPALALIRLKRYQEDAIGLNLAMQNMNNSLKPYSQLFSASDPALFFTSFDANNQQP